MKTSSKLSILVLSSVILLSGCTKEAKEAKQIEYFKAHPEKVVTTMQNCIEKARNGDDVGRSIKCLSALKYAQQRCEKMQAKGGIWYMQFNCNSVPDQAKFAMSGM
jgi:hypothetical protein